ncbi:MAG: hypothetical protein E4H36_15455 [Spirochaetales bacterium]|nr:MAG: hypothetical protein E4H36_15455 [Spirochaetales bacterium]
MKRCVIAGLRLLGLVLVIAGCSLSSYSETTLTGTIGGQAFTFADGYIDADGSAQLFNAAQDFTDAFSYDWTAVPKIMFTVNPVGVGEHKLQLNLLDLANAFTVTGYDGTTNYIFTEGTLEITEVTDTEVKGRMHITSDTDDLDGIFTLERVAW